MELPKIVFLSSRPWNTISLRHFIEQAHRTVDISSSFTTLRKWEHSVKNFCQTITPSLNHTSESKSVLTSYEWRWCWKKMTFLGQNKHLMLKPGLISKSHKHCKCFFNDHKISKSHCIVIKTYILLIINLNIQHIVSLSIVCTTYCTLRVKVRDENKAEIQ